jgi:hypothetical protein
MNFSPNSKYNLSDIDETGRLNFSDVDDFDDLSFYLRRDKVDFLIEIFFKRKQQYVEIWFEFESFEELDFDIK